MTKSIGWLGAVAVGVLISLAATGCKKDEPVEEPAAAEGKAAEGAPQEAPAEPTAEGEGEQAAAGDAEPVGEGGEARTGKEALGKAYVEIYCAQRKGETEKLFKIYEKYGFEDPKAWTKAWTEASEDNAWVARITQDAVRECP